MCHDQKLLLRVSPSRSEEEEATTTLYCLFGRQIAQGDMDFKVAGYLTMLQMDIKLKGITKRHHAGCTERAKRECASGRNEEQAAARRYGGAISSEFSALSTVKINPDKIKKTLHRLKAALVSSDMAPPHRNRR